VNISLQITSRNMWTNICCYILCEKNVLSNIVCLWNFYMCHCIVYASYYWFWLPVLFVHIFLEVICKDIFTKTNTCVISVICTWRIVSPSVIYNYCILYRTEKQIWVTRSIRRVSLVEQELLTLPKHTWVHLWFLVGLGLMCL
jgi:hypothetical protein